ncbi:hypothetical protein J4G48_0034600 [Bradyrhizobium barranii subsp. apii]|uniref:hypothetical protein n=1 Tax=Bradyrhizobium barranii TaxID=2992140 RepID=UPI001AA0F5DD|nr:hypothetical protein [Bradyrhizobium barranii]UPT94396.1 hypothetical protein J4G48_0034600 [Bradyrhizobium barranii subsp. apii]
MQAKSWAQIKITGERILENAYGANQEPVVLKESYKIAGRATVRIVTTEGTFDFPVDLDVKVDEFPF